MFLYLRPPPPRPVSLRVARRVSRISPCERPSRGPGSAPPASFPGREGTTQSLSSRLTRAALSRARGLDTAPDGRKSWALDPGSVRGRKLGPRARTRRDDGRCRFRDEAARGPRCGVRGEVLHLHSTRGGATATRRGRSDRVASVPVRAGIARTGAGSPRRRRRPSSAVRHGYLAGTRNSLTLAEEIQREGGEGDPPGSVLRESIRESTSAQRARQPRRSGSGRRPRASAERTSARSVSAFQ